MANITPTYWTDLKKKRPHLAKKKGLFHQDNARVHTSVVSTAKFHELCYGLLPHPPYAPDLAPSDYFLFANLKKWFVGKRFYSNDEIISQTNTYIFRGPREILFFGRDTKIGETLDEV